MARVLKLKKLKKRARLMCLDFFGEVVLGRVGGH